MSTAAAPPSVARRHVICGCAFIANDVIVECTGEPPGVSVGVVRATLRAVRCTKYVARMIGRPSATTTIDPEKTHVGRPIAITAALATMGTAIATTAYSPRARTNEIRRRSRIAASGDISLEPV